MDRDDDDPFAFLLSDCHVTPSQEELLRSLPFAREHEHFLDSSDESPFSQPCSYSIPMDSTPILMLSIPDTPPEEDFHTPPDDSLPSVVSSHEHQRQPVVDVGTEEMVDLSKDSDDHWGAKSTQVLDCSSLSLEGSKGGDLGIGVVDLDGDRVLKEMPVRNRESGIGVKEDGIRGFGETSVGEDDSKGVVDLDEDRVFNEMPVRNREAGIGVEEDGIKGFGEMNLDEDDCEGVVGMDEDDKPLRNREVDIGLDRGDRPSRDGIRGYGVIDVDDSESSGGGGLSRDGKRKMQARNREAEIGVDEGGGWRIDKNRRFAKTSIEDIDKFRYVGPMGSRGVGGLRELPSSTSTGRQAERNKTVMNLLNGLEFVADDVVAEKSSGDKVDFVEIAMKQGIVFSRPRWWPPEGFPDD